MNIRKKFKRKIYVILITYSLVGKGIAEQKVHPTHPVSPGAVLSTYLLSWKRCIIIFCDIYLF